ncbi:NAD(+)/NADH kinase [Desulfosporosinus sp. Sb-LF]|uniref:NAD(+)/NADH kinase n=1 Tax=Desulfosporosinus sp. Sb-LF TaxID=2560027 RepID=UPI00107F421A|nr:NAD(+)/NADH kinase [Desulfosporosinus sp. Sb-LF]TGE34244.1 NAD(+)/NADH kinase [Desulfosporosinus sp. Sb-LF]
MERVVGLWLNKSKPEAQTLALQIEPWFKARGWDVLTEWEDIVERRAQFLISLGGDGTLLQAAREGASFGIPVLGVNFGRLGFLCEIEREEIFSTLEKILRQEFKIQERLMLNAIIKRVGKDDLSQMVLNDIVFSRESNDGVITLQVNLSGEPSVSYPADGLIISTPTGSTAYSLSAFGPIISPNVQAILLTPLAAHSLSARPMVVSDHEEIQILLANGEQCLVTFDGRHSVKICAGDTVVIKTASIKAQLIRVGSRSFPQVVREKLRDRWHE